MQNILPRVNILGTEISAISLDLTVRQMASWVDSETRRYVNICTVHTVMECFQNPALRDIVNSSGMSTSDGMPLAWLCRYHGYKEATRVYGPDLMLAFCEHSISRGYRHFFYGGADGVAPELAAELERRYPGLQVAGTHSPPFRPAGEMEDIEVIDKINSARPDVIWVGLGTPKQDFWVARHRHSLDAPVLVAVGAAFDFLTGKVPQSPAWIQRSGLEWLFRLMCEPRRLAYRYLVYNPLFITHVLMQISGLRRYYNQK
ncbi:MAG: WecB/TagA/CpsF family glycosyltransferase [Thermodesulfobacteriota bacterium]|nr:WecB/TagA/CpsF family glycosyltransferase [Thermodesulfobacteriota bacterium]